MENDNLINVNKKVNAQLNIKVKELRDREIKYNDL